ncbi:MAG: glycosyl hydrolase family 30, partial [Myxococcota bacterium]
MRELKPAGDLEAIARVSVMPNQPRQRFYGVGGSLTQASAAALRTISPEKRHEVLVAYFGEQGARYGLSRTHIASSDFSEYSYTYSPEPGVFSIEEDRKNGLLDLIRDARSVPGASFELMASPWTAPPWMKDNAAYYDSKTRRGGRLLEEHYDAFARYLVNYVQAYAREGI